MLNNINLILINLLLIYLVFIIIYNWSYIKALIIITIDFLINELTNKIDISSYQFVHIANYFMIINEDVLKHLLGLIIEYFNNHLFTSYDNVHTITIVFFQLDRKTKQYYPISDKCIIDFHINESISLDELYNKIKWYKSEINNGDDIIILFKIN